MVKVLANMQLGDFGHPSVTFLRIDPEDVSITIRKIIEHFQNTSWINGFYEEYIRTSFSVRSKATIEYLEKKLKNASQDTITTEIGETVVSELSRSAIVNELGYSDIPLAEIIKQQISGNPGFDFFSEMNNEFIIFGEAKYVGGKNAYGRAMSQVDRFITESRDKSDLLDVRDFFSQKSLYNASIGERVVACGFSSTDIDDSTLIDNIIKNPYFESLEQNVEVIYIAINTL